MNTRSNYVKTKKDNTVSLKATKTVILKTYKVSKQDTLLPFLFNHISDSKNNIKHYLSNNQILVNGTPIRQFDFPLAKEDLVQLSKNPVNKKEKETIKLDIIYEDDELIAINKPSGLLSIESDTEKSNTAFRMVMDYVSKNNKRNRVFTVHRIDKDTSGVLVFAKNEELKNKLQHNWQDIVKVREYIAVCSGRFEKKQGTHKSYLLKNETNLMYSSNNKQDGKLAITNYKVIKENKDYSLVDVNIDSGRKNQIRVHMKDLGHNVVGDDKYGTGNNPLNRLGLHAYKLVFIHPITKKEMNFVAKVPSSFNKLFN